MYVGFGGSSAAGGQRDAPVGGGVRLRRRPGAGRRPQAAGRRPTTQGREGKEPGNPPFLPVGGPPRGEEQRPHRNRNGRGPHSSKLRRGPRGGQPGAAPPLPPRPRPPTRGCGIVCIRHYHTLSLSPASFSAPRVRRRCRALLGRAVKRTTTDGLDSMGPWPSWLSKTCKGAQTLRSVAAAAVTGQLGGT